MRATSIAILAGVFITMMAWVGIKAGYCLHRQSQLCEQRYQQAIDQLRGNNMLRLKEKWFKFYAAEGGAFDTLSVRNMIILVVAVLGVLA